MARLFAPDSPKLYIVRELAIVMPTQEALLLSYIGHHIVAQTPGLTQTEQGETWLVQKMGQVAAYLGVPLKTLEGISKRLRDKKILKTKALGSERKLLWGINADNILNSNIPSNQGDPNPEIKGMDSLESRGWIYNKTEIQNIGDKSPRQAMPGDGLSCDSSLERKDRMNIKEKLGHGKQKKNIPADPYIEYWNSLPGTPKCKPGSKAYEKGRAFFKAYCHYEVGRDRWFLPAEYKPILKEINQEAAHKKGKRPAQRPHDEMLLHIEMAAFAFHPEYHPQDKRGLKKLGLSGFLYNSYSRNNGQSSAFCKFVHKPVLRLDDTANTVIERLTDFESEVMDIVKEIYCFANNCDSNSLSDKEEISAAKVARDISKRVEGLRHVSTIHYRDVYGFLRCWKDFCIEELVNAKWQMPVTALYTKNDMWRKFEYWLLNDCNLSSPLFYDDSEATGSEKEKPISKKSSVKTKEVITKNREEILSKASEGVSEEVIRYSQYVIDVANHIIGERWQDDECGVETIFNVTQQILSYTDSKHNIKAETVFMEWRKYAIACNGVSELGDESVTRIDELGTGRQYWLWNDFIADYNDLVNGRQ